LWSIIVFSGLEIAIKVAARKESNMEVKRNGSQPSSKGPEDWFTGTVRVDPLFQANAPARAAGVSVTFEPGARTAWHTHPLGQTLIVTAGCGRAQRWEGPIEELRPGDVVWIAPGEKHWHGAAPTTAMTHIAIHEHLDGEVVEWMEKVSHAFQNFLELDKEVFGGNYSGHHKKDVPTRLTIAPGAEDHPVLEGYEPFESLASLYKTGLLAEDTTLLLSGTHPNDAQPLAWTRESKGGRVFYTSLGSVEDFEQAPFRRIVANALFWCAGREITEVSRAN
jgi:quercetin dioxygenase-like cupin family protein